MKEVNMASVLVVGSVALDSVETPHGKRENMLGGSATYFSMAASHFSSIRMVAVVGTDFPEDARQLLNAKKIDLAGLQFVEGQTFRWSGEYRGSMNEAITHDTQLNVFQNFNPVLPPEYCDSEWVFLGNIDPTLQLSVLSQVRRPRLVALDTMNFWIESARPELLKVLREIDLLVINEGELRLLTGENSVPAGVKAMCKMGPKGLIVKRGEFGSILYFQDTWFFVPGFPESGVVDPTGAGDSFAGGFMGSLAQSGQINRASLRTAMVHGSIMASYNITDFGPWKLANLSKEQITERFQAFTEMVTI
jgi:sugar/nucleoside kinase (ribokinase family)